MDRLDFAILTTVIRDPFASWRDIGERVGVSGTAVRNRVQRLREDGIFHGWRVLPAAEIFDRVPVLMVFDPDQPTRQQAHRALEADPVVWTRLHHDGTVGVYAYTEDIDAMPPEELVELYGAEPAIDVQTRVPVDPPGDPVLSPLDWRVLEHLIPDPRMELTELADRTGLSHKTVRRRRDALWGDNLIYVGPQLDEGAEAGLMIYHLFVETESVDALERVQAFLERGRPYARLQEPPGLLLVCRAQGYEDALEDTSTVQALDEVVDTRFTVTLTNRAASDRMVEWVQERLEDWDRASSD